jgi:hypothetical protein
MHICPTTLIAAALTVGLLITDFWHIRQDRMIAHLFLGGLMTLLFYGLCAYGYEALNWGFLAIFPAVVILAYISTWFYGTSPVSMANCIQRGPSIGGCSTCSQKRSSCGRSTCGSGGCAGNSDSSSSSEPRHVWKVQYLA